MNENKFNYTYKAPTESERREIDSIRRQYEPATPQEQGLARLRALDSRVKGIPQAVSLILGVLGLLIFGLGLTCVLEWDLLALGIILMVAGIPPMAAAYPIHNKLLKKLKAKHSKEILELSEFLLKSDE